MRVASYLRSDAADSSTPCSRALSVNKHVNDGYRSGVQRQPSKPAERQATITPRMFYQRIDLNGWNRNDIYNILANPYTTTRPAVTLGDARASSRSFRRTSPTIRARRRRTSIYRPRPDIALTSITSYTDRDILVVRDAGALTASITGGSIGLPRERLHAQRAAQRRDEGEGVHAGMRVAGGKHAAARGSAGGFFGHTNRHYGQNLPVTGFAGL